MIVQESDPGLSGFVKPYIFSILPAGSVPLAAGGDTGSAPAQPTFYSGPVLQIHSSISLQVSQSLPFPFNIPNSPQPTLPTPLPVNHTLRLLTPSPSAKSPLFLVSTPTDRATAAAEGSSIWCFRVKPWGEQVNELVKAGTYAEALALVNSIDAAVLPDKVCTHQTSYGSLLTAPTFEGQARKPDQSTGRRVTIPGRRI
jgi:Vam6/Vps39-like protein vacuolar protein sorting-associated protein 39